MVRSLRSGLKSICVFALLSLATAAPPPLAAQTTGSTWQLIDPPPSGGVSSQSVSGEAKTVYVIDGQAGVAASPLPQEFKDQLVPPTSGTVSTSSVPDEDVYIVGKEIVDGILASEAAGELTPEIEAIAEPLDEETSSASTYSGDGMNSITANSMFDCATHEKVVNRTIPLTDRTWGPKTVDLGNGFTGTLTVKGDLDGQANLEVKFNLIRKKVLFKCVPWSVSFKSARVHGNATSDEGVTLTGAVNYQGKFGPWNIAKPELFSVTFPVGPIPVTIGFNLPIIAGLDLTAAVTGTVNYNGTHVATGTFDYTCTLKDCIGSSNFSNVGENGATQTITGGADGRVKPTPWVDIAFRAYLYDDWLAYAQVGVRPHALGDLWGYTGNFCGDAAADGHFETVRALTFDLDSRIDWTGEAGAFGKKRWGKTLKTGSISHIGFWDVNGNSTAMQPHFHGTSSLYEGDAGGNKVRMRPCWPYTENVTYQINWGDGSPVQQIQGAPGTELTPNHTWTTAGTRTASATAVKDAHGRTINQSTSRTIEVKAITPLSVTVTAAPASITYGKTLTVTATALGGHAPTIQYTLGRRRAGTSNWLPVPLQWQAGNALTWTPDPADVGTWDLAVGVKDKTTAPDANGLGYAAFAMAGTVQVVPPLVLTCPTATQRTVTSGTTITWSGISSTGGTPGTIQYTFVRQLTGNASNPWLPNPLVWRADTDFSWTPTASDLGTWQFHAMAKDVNSPANPGYTSTCNMGQIVVVSPLTVSVTPSPATSMYGTEITWTATATGGTPATTKFAWFRRKVGTTTWTPDVSAAIWQTIPYKWTPGAADIGDWEIVVWVKDGNTPANANTYGYAHYANAGPVKVVPPPLGLSVTVNPTQVVYGNPVTITATASGGTPATIQYAFFRRRAGTTTWTPDVTAPAWQASNVQVWTPTSADIGTWDIYVWVKDANTPANQNTYGYGAGANGGTVKVVTPPLTLTSTASPGTVYHSLPINWTATTGGGTPATTQVALFRRRVGTTTWTPAVTAPAWQTSKTLSWTPTSAETGSWEISIWVKDGDTPANQNTYGYATSHNPGTVQVVNPPTLNVTMSPASVNYGTTITWTASATSSNTASLRYAFFRRRSGTTTWIPSVSAPNWQTSNVHSWATTSADAGDWDTYVWVKDAYTPASMNTYGYAAGFNTGGVRVVTPITYLTCSANRSGAYHGTTFTWSANVSGGDASTLRYALLRRKVGTTTWIPAQTSPSWQSGSSFSWTPSSTETGSWEISIWVKDVNTASNANTYGYALSCNPGTIQVLNPPTVSGTSSPSQSPYGATISWTATASGGDSSSYRYAIFRRRAGTSTWTPDVNSPSWQSSRTFSWTPTSADVGTWEVFIWVKDAYTPSNMNTYGHAAWYNAGNVEVTTPAPVDVTGTGSPSTSP
ncbi:MAG TPA: hypothetical protein VJ885_01095, partial [Thermoanaerobaculia bacterium]|nr:hypothetical protein [Thermoanaerobaculia bacterium]